jgi:hypothetical protein
MFFLFVWRTLVDNPGLQIEKQAAAIKHLKKKITVDDAPCEVE